MLLIKAMNNNDMLSESLFCITYVGSCRHSCVSVSGEALGRMMDVQCSLDEQWRALLSEETRLDLGDTLLRELSDLRKEGSEEGKRLKAYSL